MFCPQVVLDMKLKSPREHHNNSFKYSRKNWSNNIQNLHNILHWMGLNTYTRGCFFVDNKPLIKQQQK